MKALLCKLLITVLAVTALASFILTAPKPKLLPQVESFYAALTTSPAGDRSNTLRDITSCIISGMASDKKLTMVFTCPDNSFKSQAAQIVLQSLLSTDKQNRLSAVSFGATSATIDPKLLAVLRKHGFVVTAGIQGQSWDVKAGENMPVITVLSKTAAAPGLPTADFFLVKLCSPDETCGELSKPKYTFTLPFEKVGLSMTEDEADKVFTQIATDIVYAYKKSIL